MQGLSFELTDEQRSLRALAHEFAEQEILPRAADYDERQTHPADVLAKAHELGLTNIHVPAEYGGPELGLLEAVLIGEELCWGCSGMATTITGNELAAGSDVARLKATARRTGGEYVLNGAKTFITNAGHAAWSVVFAKTDPGRGNRGLSAFVVPMETPGVTVERHLDKMGQRASETSAFSLADVVVPAASRLGAEGDGFEIAMRTLDATRPATASGAVGVARAAFEHAKAYAAERVAFDRPIAMHQGVGFLIADMATKIEAARLLTWQAAWMVDHGWGRKATLYSSMAKRFAADTAMEVTTDAVQVFGGYGYTKEFPVEKLMRDAKLFQIYEGTSQIQRVVIAKEIFLPRD